MGDPYPAPDRELLQKKIEEARKEVRKAGGCPLEELNAEREVLGVMILEKIAKDRASGQTPEPRRAELVLVSTHSIRAFAEPGAENQPTLKFGTKRPFSQLDSGASQS